MNKKIVMRIILRFTTFLRTLQIDHFYRTLTIHSVARDRSKYFLNSHNGAKSTGTISEADCTKNLKSAIASPMVTL